jgi:murein DD-endopeptidase MepM/ murein hydrolase activator NlpD
MALNPVSGVKNLTSAVSSLKKELNSVNDIVKSLKKDGAGALGEVTKIVKAGGALQLGQGNTLFNSTTEVTTAGRQRTRDNFLASSQPGSQAQANNARYTSMPQMTAAMARFQIAGGAAQMGLGLFAGAYQAMPDLGTTVARAGGYYGSAIAGNVNRPSFQRATMNALYGGTGRGITGAGEDAAAAAMLVQGYNYAPGSKGYLQTMGEVGGAARYLNMGNATAAQAIGGFQTGQMGANLYQYGISQFDKKGNPVSQSSIAKQLFGRMFQNGANEKDVQMSLQYGIAGANLRTMGFSEEQQSILAQQFKMISRGENPDLAAQKGSGNPLSAAQKITASETNLMERGETAMIKGFEQAATAVTKLNKALEGLPDLIFQMKGAIQGFVGSNAGKGTATAAGGLMAGVNNIIKGVIGLKALKMITGARTAATAMAATSAGATAATGAATTAGTTAAVAGTAATAGALAPLAATTALTLGIPAVSLGAGYLLGKKLKPILNPDRPPTAEELLSQMWQETYNPKTKGGGNVGFGASFGFKGGTSGAQSPIPGVAPSAAYGDKDPNVWGGGSRNYHTGQDYPVPAGTDVRAVMPGIVIDDIGGNKDFGIYVQIDHQNGYQTIYGHLSSKAVSIGQPVNKGDVIGKSGDTGNVTGPHLHFEVRKGKNNPVDPDQLMSGGSVLSQATGGGGTTAPTGGAGSTGGGGTAGIILGTGEKQSWAKQFLDKLGKPVTDDNIKAVTTWMAWEGGHWNNSAHNNPLNTTLKTDHVTGSLKNTPGVRRYDTWDAGLQATVDTINVGKHGYPAILDALSKGDNAQAVISAVNNSKWGTNIPTKGGASVGYGASVPTAQEVGATNNVNIYVTVQSASEEEVMRLSSRIKEELEKDHGRRAMVGN